MRFLFMAAFCLAPLQTQAQNVAVSTAPARAYTIHFQATVIDQGHARFTAPYTGPHSLQPMPESAASVTSTLFLGYRVLPGTELYVNPELAGGRGMSGSLGVAGFPNGETPRIGDPSPTIYTARLFLKQTFGFGDEKEILPDGPDQLAGAVAARRLTLVAGKFALLDYFAGSAYAHDPRGQFFNWTLMAPGAWDYAADTHGYTWGLMAEYHAPQWAVRAAAAAEPKVANMLDMDRRVGRAHSITLEGEHQLRWGPRKGTARLLAFLNESDMGNYDQAAALGRQTAVAPDIAQTRAYGRSKVGLATSDDLELSDELGGFAMASWNDGRNETWAFTEVDASQALGLEWKPSRWGRPQDRWGAAAVVNELSGPHRRYLASGGLGFILGDGGLHYGPEMIAETYYRWQVLDQLFISPDAQLVANPAYNRSRGPVPVWGFRVHAEF